METIDREYRSGLVSEKDAEIERLQDRVTRAEAAMENEALITRDQAYEIERLRAALKPFADFAEFVAANHPGWDHDHFTIFERLTMEPFRKAGAIHQQSEQPKD